MHELEGIISQSAPENIQKENVENKRDGGLKINESGRIYRFYRF